MRNVQFDGAIQIGKPANMRDEDCGSAWALPVDEPLDLVVGPAGETQRVDCRKWIMAYLPNKEDIEAINAGRPIYLSIMGKQLAPHAVWTMNENDEANV